MEAPVDKDTLKDTPMDYNSDHNSIEEKQIVAIQMVDLDMPLHHSSSEDEQEEDDDDQNQDTNAHNDPINDDPINDNPINDDPINDDPINDDDSSRRKSFSESMEDIKNDIQHEAYVDWLFCRLVSSVCFHSFPFGSLLGLCIAIAGCKYQLDGIFSAEPILVKYMPDDTANLVFFCLMASASIVAVNAVVLVQGIAIFIIQSQRKCCGHRTLGCHCDKNCKHTIKEKLQEREHLDLKKEGDATAARKAAKKKAAKRAIAFFKSADKDGDGTISIAEFETFMLSNADKQAALRRSTKHDDEEGIDNRCLRCCCHCIEGSWAIVGTVFIWSIYFLSIAISFPSAICYMLTWMLGQLCAPFEEKSQAYIVIAENYIIEAKIALGESDEMAREIMKKFGKFKDMQKMFNEGGKAIDSVVVVVVVGVVVGVVVVVVVVAVVAVVVVAIVAEHHLVLLMLLYFARHGRSHGRHGFHHEWRQFKFVNVKQWRSNLQFRC